MRKSTWLPNPVSVILFPRSCFRDPISAFLVPSRPNGETSHDTLTIQREVITTHRVKFLKIISHRYGPCNSEVVDV
jgi:hypothetical protein